MAYYHVLATDAAGDGSGDSWANAMTLAEWIAWIDSASYAAGDIYYIKEDTYTLTATLDLSDRPGTSVAPVSLIGVKAGTTNEGANIVYSDWSTGLIDGGADDRPDFDVDGYYIVTGNYYKIFNIIFAGNAGTADRLLNTSTASVSFNVKISNTTSTSDKWGVQLGSYGKAIACEIVNENGYGVSLPGGNYVLYSYVHDCKNGLGCSGHAFNVISSIIADCSVNGATMGSCDHNLFLSNTFYNCPVGILASDSYDNLIINNIIDNCADAFKWSSAQQDANIFLRNHEGNNVTRMYDTTTNKISELLPHTDFDPTSGDPKFTTPGSDFSLQSDSPCIDEGLAMVLGVG